MPWYSTHNENDLLGGEGILQSYFEVIYSVLLHWYLCGVYVRQRLYVITEGQAQSERERVSESEKEEGERWGNSILLQLIFFKYFTWILAAVVLQKTKGNEPWLLEPKTTHSVRKSRHSNCLEHRERQSQSKLLKSASGYMKHIGKKISWWKNICDVAGGKWFCQGEHPHKKQVNYRAGVLLLLNDNKLVVWGISGLIFKQFREIIRLHCKKMFT